MSELEALTKTLIQVVGSLQDMINKRGDGHNRLEPDQTRLKKTPEMTYNEFIQKALENRRPLQVASKKSSYRLQEDLRLLSELTKYNQISIKTFEEISKSKKINRTTESLRSRYHDFLYRIDEGEMKKIVAWIQKQGLDGYLVFDEEIRVQANDPREIKEERKRPRAGEKEIKVEKKSKVSKLSLIPTNCKQLSEVLRLYSKMVNIPVKTLVEKLDQLSGDLIALDAYIESKDARMLWTSEQDQILRRGGSQLQILKRYRKQGVETRKKYLGIS